MASRPRRRWLAAAAVSTLALVTAAAPALSLNRTEQPRATHDGSARQTYERLTTSRENDDVRLDLLAINDFHGNLEPIPATSSSGRINNTPAGGVEFLARHLINLRRQAAANGAETLTVAAGDLIGASPLLSAAFHDEPTIEAMNKIKLQVASVGNHEFDEGYKELLRMQSGGCLDDGDGANNQNSCPDPNHRFRGAKFQYLAANVLYDDGLPHSGQPIFPAYKIFEVSGIKVGFIGMTLKDTPTIVTRSGVEGLKFTDEVTTANELVPKLRQQGVQAIVILLHQGVVPSDPTAYNDCSGVSGPALAIAEQFSPEIDAVISGHTHQPYNCTVQDPNGRPRLLTSASSFGRLVTDVHLLLDPKTHDVVRRAAYAVNSIVRNNNDGPDPDSLPDTHVEPVAALTELIALYKELVAPIANKVIGHLDPPATTGQVLSRTPDADGSGDSPLGNLIADAQRTDSSVIPPGGTAPTIAFMNPGGIRADLIENSAGDITFEAAFTVQPFNNYDVTMDLTGQQILNLLEQQWDGGNAAPNNKILQVSGIEYTWDKSNAADNSAPAVVPGSVQVDTDGDGTVDSPIDVSATYRVECNSFLSDGGDNFTVFASGTNKYFGGLDIDALANYLTANDPYTPTPTDRIDAVP
jgi:5'-nucleotidase